MSGEVSRPIIISVLTAHKVKVVKVSVNGSEIFALTKGPVTVVYRFYDDVGRRILHQLQRKIDIPIIIFTIPKSTKRTRQKPTLDFYHPKNLK